MKNFLAFAIVCLSVSAFAQDNQYDANEQFRFESYLNSNFTPPKSPEAAAFAKYGDFPVNFYTGSVDIRVPLHTLQGSDISLPVSLRYDASGIKGNQLPTWVGLGWNLEAGGVVSQAIQGHADNYENYYSPGARAKHELIRQNNGPGADLYDAYYEIMRDHTLDMQPDHYSFNFPGASGKFYILPTAMEGGDPEDYIVKKEANDLLITPYFSTTTVAGDVISSLDSFVIVNDYGVSYTFAEIETTVTFPYPNGSPHQMPAQRSRSWYLTRIVNANQTEEVILQYDSFSSFAIPVPDGLGNSRRLLTYSEFHKYGACPEISDYCGSALRDLFGRSVTTVESKVWLREATLYRAGSVVSGVECFTSPHPNPPAGTPYRFLNDIRVYSGPNSDLIRQFNLNYSNHQRYFQLLNVYERGPDNVPLPGHSFQYTDRTYDNLTSSLDYWGYYNGRPNGNNLVPRIYNSNGTIDMNPSGADRRPSYFPMLSGSLRKIIYPTGGYTEFDFEPHRADMIGDDDIMVGGLRIKTIRSYASNGVTAYTKHYDYELDDGTPSGKLLDGMDITSESQYNKIAVGVPGSQNCHEHSYAWQCDYTTIHSSLLPTAGAREGHHVGYSQVTERHIGKTVYKYKNQYNPGPHEYNSSNGELTEVAQYDVTDKLISRKAYEYASDINENRRHPEHVFYIVRAADNQDNRLLMCQSSDDYVYSWYIDTGQPPQGGCVSYGNRYDTKVTTDYFNVRGYWRYVSKVTDTQYYYAANGSPNGSVSTVTDIAYGTDKVNKPTTVTATNSNYEEVRSRYIYPDQENIDLLVDRNIVAMPVIKQRFVDNSLVHTVGIDYAEYNSNGLPATGSGPLVGPHVSYEKFYNRAQVTREIVDALDETGNIRQVHRNYDVPSVLVYGHHRTLPVAVVQNALRNQVAFTSFEQAESTMDGEWLVEQTKIIDGNQAGNSGAKVGRYFIRNGKVSKSLTSNLTRSVVSGYVRNGSSSNPTSTLTLSGASSVSLKFTPPDDEGWAYFEYTFNPTNLAGLELRCTADLDEVRLFPVGALMNTATYYDDTRLLAGQGTPDGNVVSFAYDSHRRLIETRDFDGNVVLANEYNYGSQTSGMSSTTNRVVSHTPRTAGVSSGAAAAALSNALASHEYNYVDGLGRPLQMISRGSAPDWDDIIQLHQYDVYGREVRQYLPYNRTNTGGSYQSSATTQQQQFYQNLYPAEAAKAYRETVPENSPLNRPILNKLAGTSLHAHPAMTVYRTNTTGEVRLFDLTHLDYPANSLHVVETTDADGRVKSVFTDKFGRKVMEQLDDSKTYFIYDRLNKISQVITPAGAAATENNGPQYNDRNQPVILSNSYRYIYSGNSDLLTSVQKPGEDYPTLMWYDRLQRPVLTRYGSLNRVYTKYDILSRPIMTGSYKGSATPSNSDQLYEIESSSGSHKYTTNRTFPKFSYSTSSSAVARVFTATKYDDYDWDNNGSTDDNYATATGYAAAAHSFVRGQTTRTVTGVLNDQFSKQPTAYLALTSFYDRRLRVISTRENNHLGGTDSRWMAYDFVGNQLRSRHLNQGPGGTHVFHERMSYDHRDRLELIEHRIGDAGGYETIADYRYDVLGRESSKWLGENGGGGPLQYVDMDYSINGWLRRINDPEQAIGSRRRFAMQLFYNDVVSTGVNSTPQFGGNISAVKWRTSGESESQPQVYNYYYDDMSRLTSAVYRGSYGPDGGATGPGDGGGGGFGDGGALRGKPVNKNGTDSWNNAYRYSVTGITYDANGNLLTLNRRGKRGGGYGFIDQLSYSYDSFDKDRLLSVTDASGRNEGHPRLNGSHTGTFSYDRFGNVTAQQNRNHSNFSYNYLNLPRSGSTGAGSFTITYDAGGRKLRQQMPGRQTADYVGNLIFRGGTLSSVQHAEGQISYVNGSASYEYYLRDHLGNVRVRVRDTGSSGGTVVATHAYYAFGLEIGGLSDAAAGELGDMRYNGKELSEELGWYDYGARWYDPAVARWGQLDPLADRYSSISPYTYVANNPLLYIDPDGRQLYLANNEGLSQAINDILALVDDADFKGSVVLKFEDSDKGTKVDADFGDLSEDQVSGNAGLNLLKNVINSDRNYLYEVGTTVSGVDRDSGKPTEEYSLGTPSSKGSIGLNLSTTPRGDSPAFDLPQFSIIHSLFNSSPRDGFDGHVVVSPNAGDARQSANGGRVPRGWFTFHELTESYNRTDLQQGYKEAHKNAQTAGEGFHLTPPGWNQSVTNPYAKKSGLTTRQIRNLLRLKRN